MDTRQAQLTRASVRVTWVGAVVNAALVAIKLAAGVIGNSQALIADAVHSLSDFVTDGVVLLGVKIGRGDADASHPYGHGRIETLAATFVGLCLVGIGGFFAYDAGTRLLRGHFDTAPSWFTLVAAGLSIASKEVLFHYTLRIGQTARSRAVIANAWHHRSDAFSSVIVLLGTAGAQIGPAWHVFDTYAAMAVALIIIAVALRLLWDSLREITDAAPQEGVVDGLRAVALGVPGVVDLHGLKVRTAGFELQIEIDIVVDATISVTAGHDISLAVKRALCQSRADVGNVIVHVDPLPQHDNAAANETARPA